jgi:hypothetical protein
MISNGATTTALSLTLFVVAVWGSHVDAHAVMLSTFTPKILL